MPRGKRKLGRYRISIWWPNGNRSGRETTKDLTPDEFASALREDMAEMLARLEGHEADRATRMEALKDL
jgi:hypothetical protein